MRAQSNELVQVQCRGLTQLEITFELHYMMDRGALVSLELLNATCLEECMLVLKGEPEGAVGDVRVSLVDTPAELVAADAKSVISPRPWDNCHYLRILASALAALLEQAPLRRSVVSFRWARCSAAGELGWKVAVQ